MTTESRLDFGARRTWAAFFAVIVLGLVAGGYGFYQVEAPRIRLAKCNELAAIGGLKAGEILQWRQERLNDASKDVESPFFAKAAKTWRKDSGNLALRDDFIEGLKLEQRIEGYADALLLDVDGRLLLAAKDAPGPVDAATMKAVAQALGGKQAVLSDLFRSPDGDVYLDAVATVRDADNRPFAFLVLRSDATKFLYPLIQSWPIPSETAETVLVQKEGDDVLFLSAPRYQAGAALSLRIPLTQEDVPAVQAVQGKQGVFEGKDYRGVEVLSDLRPVPGSPWFVVAKVDASEIMAEVGYRARLTIVIVVIFILLAAALVAFLYRHRQVRIYRALRASEREKHKAGELLQESEGLYRSLFENMLNGFAYCRMLFEDGKPQDIIFLAVNAAVESQTGLKGVVGRKVTEVIPGIRETDPQLFEICGRVAMTGQPERFEMFVEALQMWLWISVYSPAHEHFVAVFDVITERKRAAAERESGRDYLANIVNAIGDPVFVKDDQHRFVLVNDAQCALMGRSRTELIGRSDADFFAQEQVYVFWEMDDEVLSTGRENVNEELLTDSRTGETRTIVTRKTRYVDPSGNRFVVGVIRDITERKRTEEALRESEERYRTIFDEALDGLCLADAGTGLIIDCNKSLAALVGRERAKLIGQSQTILHRPSGDQGAYSPTFRQHLTGKEGQVLETQVVTSTGTIIEVEIKANRVTLPEGKALVGVFRDITDLKHAMMERGAMAEVLRLLNASNESHDLMRTVVTFLKNLSHCEAVGIRIREGDDYPYFEVSGFPEQFVEMENRLCLHDAQGLVVRDAVGNPVLECMCGNILCGRFDPSKPFFTPRGSFWTNCTTELLASTTEADYPGRTRNRCNSAGYESVALIALRNDDNVLGLIQLNDKGKGRFTPAFIALVERMADSITKALAEKLAREALRESEERYRTVADFTYDWEYWLGPDHRFIYCSPACERITGYRADEFEKDPDLLMAIIHPDDRDGFAHHQDDATSLGPETHELEFRILTRSGEVRWIAHTCRTVRGRDGTYLGRRASNRDVNDRKWAEAEREKLEGRLRQAQKMEAVGQLAGGVAHDFNNLLQAILGFTELVQIHLGADTPDGQMLGEVRKSAERAADLTRQLLTFGRRQMIQPVYLDLNTVVKGVLKMVRRVIGEHIEICFAPGETLRVVHADTVQMEQILMNLCVNARDAMPAGGSLTIETQNEVLGDEYCRDHPWATAGRYVLLSVTDTGHGMDEATRAQIFEPFFTTKGVGEGTGLGLATVYGIVKQHKGLIDVYSEPGKGSAFKVYFTAVERPAEMAGLKVEGPVVGGSETILVAEDDELVRNLVTDILQTAGYTVLTARDGEEALRVFDEHADSIDMAVLDIMMPRLSGVEVMGRIRAKCPGARFLFSSGYSEEAGHANFIVKEGPRLITKPYHRADLLRAVRETLDAPPSP